MYNLELKPRRHFWNNAFLDRELDKFFEGATKQENFFTPACEIVEEEKRYAISMDIPGMNKDDINLEVKENHLYVTGERKWETRSEKDSVLRTEKRYGKFSRVFTLPQNVNPEMIEARFENGVLDIYLPKEEKAQTRKITIGEKKAESVN
jgi:HSP20 family protein